MKASTSRPEGRALEPNDDARRLHGRGAAQVEHGGNGQGGPVDRIEEALQTVARTFTQVRLHERLLQKAGVRLDRGGASLLSKLHLNGDPLRVTALAEMLGVDAPTVTRKVHQLEREGLVSRQDDPDDKRATRIKLTPAGRRTLERMLAARRTFLNHLLEGWEDTELSSFATLLAKFAAAVDNTMEDLRDS